MASGRKKQNLTVELAGGGLLLLLALPLVLFALVMALQVALLNILSLLVGGASIALLPAAIYGTLAALMAFLLYRIAGRGRFIWRRYSELRRERDRVEDLLAGTTAPPSVQHDLMDTPAADTENWWHTGPDESENMS